MVHSKGMRKLHLLLLLFILALTTPSLAATCPYCARESSLKGYADGRMFCNVCLEKNVFTMEAATPLRWEVESFLTKVLGNNRYAVSFTLYDQPEFDVFRQRARLASSIDGIYLHRERTVTMRSGLAPLNFQGLLVHESTHAWQHQFCPLNQDRALKEGFATFLQHRFLQEKKAPRHLLESLVNNSDPDYGAAAKQLLKKEKQLGLFALIDKVRQSKTLAQVMAD